MRFLAVLAALVVVTTAVWAADWPQYLGPQRNGTSSEIGLARQWPAGGPKVLWTVPVNEGYAGPAVRDGKVYLMERDEVQRQDILRVLDLNTGKELWRFTNPTWRKLDSYPGARSTPTVDGKYVYFTGVIGDVYCIDQETHQAVWHHYLSKEFANPSPKWGYSASPVIYKDLVIVPVLSEKVGLVAYDKRTGELRWQSAHIGRLFFTHMTPLVTTLCGVDQVVMLGNVRMGPEAYMSGIDVNTGKVLWRIQLWRHYNIPINTPVNIGNDTLFVAGGYRVGCFTLQVRREGDVWSTAYGFKDNTNCTPSIQTPILFNGFIYAQSTDKPHNTIARDMNDDRTMANHGLECLDLQGNIRWETGKDDDMNQGGLLIADGLIYAMDGSNGELRLVEAIPNGYHELGRAKVLEIDAKTSMTPGAWAPLALSEGKLLCRDGHQLKCLDMR